MLEWSAIATLAASGGLVPGAGAYWSGNGQASAPANLATLSAPAISNATAGPETVALAWSPVTAPGPGTVEYFVTRDGGAPGGACPSSSVRSTATTCTDVGVVVGPHEYSVTAVWRTWTATSVPVAVTVASGPVTHFQLEAATSTPTAGEGDALTITAKDAGGNTVASYSGVQTLIFEGAAEAFSGTLPVVLDRAGRARSFGEPTELVFTEGKASVSGAENGVMKLYRTEEAHVTVTDGGIGSGAGLAITVKAAAFKSFSVVANPAEPEAGAPSEAKLTAVDEWHNTITTYTRTHKLHYEGAESSPSGHVPEYSTTTEPTFSHGEASVTGFRFYRASTTTLKIKEETTGHEGAATFVVKPAATKKLVVATPSEQEAGVPFNEALSATDEYGNLTPTYTGTKTLSWSGPGTAPNGTTPEYPASATTVTFSEGNATATAIKLYDAQSTTLKAKEGTIEGTTPTFTIKAAAATSLNVPTPSEREAGVAFTVTVTAYDPWHNTVKTFAGAKALTWSGPASSPGGKAPAYPATVTFAAGVGTASIKLYDAQSTALAANEGALEGTTTTFVVKPAATKKLAVATPSEQEAGVPFNEALSATDEYGNLTPTYTGTKTLSWSGPGTAPNGTTPEYPASATTVTFSEGNATATAIKLYDAQSTTLKAKEGTIEGTTPTFTIKAAAATSLNVPTPSEREAGVAFTVTVTAYDPWHNTVKTFAGAKALTWSGPASSPGGKAPAYPATVTFAAGVGTASIKLYDAQSTALAANEGALEGTTTTFVVKPAATKKLAVATPSEQEAGVPFNEALSATDEYGNLTPTYTGTKTLSWSGPGTAPNGTTPEYPASATTVTFSEGNATATAIKLYDAQSTTLKAKEGTIEGTTPTFTIKASTPERFAWSHPEVTAGKLEAGTCPFACVTSSIGNGRKFKARASVADRYGNVVSGLIGSHKATVEKASGEGTLTSASGLTISSTGLAESATVFEYTSPATGTNEAVLRLKAEAGTAYTEAEAHVKY